MNTHGPTPPRTAAGAATLVMAIVLLCITTLMVLYLDRGLVFEQKASANQMRATIAQEAAEAGLDWAAGMLNHPEGRSATCEIDVPPAPSFRIRYVVPGSTAAVASPGCSIGASGLDCACPATGDATLAGTPQAGFTVSLAPDPQDPNGSVRIRSQGCAAPPSACTPANADAADAAAVAFVTVKLRPLLRAAPLSALTCGGNCQLIDQVALASSALESQGLLLHAGGNASAGPGVSLRSLPGTPGHTALVTHDPALSALAGADPTCTQGLLFHAYFGAPLAAYAAAPTVLSLDCAAQSSCTQPLATAYARGWRAFHLPTGLVDDGAAGPLQLGTPSDPVLLVSAGAVRLGGPVDIHGLLYLGHPGPDALRADSARFTGAVVACADLRLGGGTRLSYSTEVLQATRNAGSLMAKVPGTWKDFE